MFYLRLNFSNREAHTIKLIYRLYTNLSRTNPPVSSVNQVSKDSIVSTYFKFLEFNSVCEDMGFSNVLENPTITYRTKFGFLICVNKKLIHQSNTKFTEQIMKGLFY